MKKNALIIFLTFWIHTLYAQSPEADSLKKSVNDKTLHDTIRAKACSKLSYILLRNRFMAEAQSYAEKGIELSKKNNFQKGYINNTNALAACYSEVGRYEESVRLFNECITFCKKAGNTYGVMSAFNKMGLLYYNWGRFKEAIRYYMQALEMAEKEKRYESVAMYQNNIAMVYGEMNDYEKAIAYTQQAIELEKKHGNNPENIIIRSINLSDYYNESKQLEKSELLLKEMLRLNDSLLKNTTYEAYLRHNLGQTYFRDSLFARSINEYLFARKIFSEIDPMATAQIDKNLAYAYSAVGQHHQALEYLKKGLAGEASTAEQKRYGFHVASLVYEAAGDYKLALFYAKKLLEITDTLFNREQAEVVTEMQTRYETKQKQDSLKFQKIRLGEEQKLNGQIAADSKQKSVLLIVAVICIVALVFLIALAWINYRKKQKANLLLQEQKQLIEEKNSENELLLGEIHHRVKNNLQVISSLLSLQGKSIEDKTARSAIEEGKQRVRSMELVHKMLYEGSSFASIEMVEFSRQLVNNLLDGFGVNRSEFQLQISSPPIRLDVDTAVPMALIINELVVNALKHAFDKGHQAMIRISITETTSGLVLMVADNGKGTNAAALKTNDSFGLKLVRLLTRQLNGQMEVVSENGLQYTFLMKEYKLVK